MAYYVPPPVYAPPPVYPCYPPPVAFAPQPQPTVVIQQAAQPQKEKEPAEQPPKKEEEAYEEPSSCCCFTCYRVYKAPEDHICKCFCWELIHIKTVCLIVMVVEALIILVQWYFVKELGVDESKNEVKGVAALDLLMTLVLIVGIICCLIGIFNTLPNLVMVHVIAQGVVVGCLLVAGGLEAYATVSERGGSYLRTAGLFAYMVLQIWWSFLFCQLKSYVVAVTVWKE